MTPWYPFEAGIKIHVHSSSVTLNRPHLTPTTSRNRTCYSIYRVD
uniref:Uncharacterized protein n=1 Tax=Arundo donax TaxID=35708 RepID=A0A0A9BXA3_ARUDO